MNINWQRVWGIILRHLYNFRHAYDRITDAFYWPSLDILIWGLTISALQTAGNTKLLQITMILTGVILWYVIWRGQYEITVSILEELWSENLVNLFVAPISLVEWVIGLLGLGFIKLFITVAFTALVAWFLYAVNIFTLGFILIPFIISLLITGWAFGLFVGGLFLRYGTNIQTLAWAGGYLLMPFSGTYYPLSSLPQWVQKVAMFIPSSYIFEGMRQGLFTHTLDATFLYKSFLLNAIYFSLALWFFDASFKQARKVGLAHLK